MLGLVCLLAFPPSPLFISELMIFKQIIADERWWLLAILILLLCFVMYGLCLRILRLCFKPTDVSRIDSSRVNLPMTWTALLLILCAVVLGIMQPPALIRYLNAIIAY